jgi:outer membrane protein assembly factor BamB
MRPLLTLVLAAACAALTTAADAADPKRVEPLPATLTAPDLSSIGRPHGLLARDGRLYVGATGGVAVIEADGKLAWSTPLAAANVRWVDVDGGQVAWTSYVVQGVQGTGELAGALLGEMAKRFAVASAEVGLVGADGQPAWSVAVADPSALSPPALGKDAVAVQGSKDLKLFGRADGAALPDVRMFIDYAGMSGNITSRMPVTRPLWQGDEVLAAHQSYFKKVSAKGAELGSTKELGKEFTYLLSGPVLCKDKILLGDAARVHGGLIGTREARVFAANAQLKPIWSAGTQEDVNGIGDLVCSDDLVFVVSSTRVAAFTHDGKEAWDYESKGGVLIPGTHRGVDKIERLPIDYNVTGGEQVVVAGPYLYVTSRAEKKWNGKLDVITVFDAKSGKLLEQIDVKTKVVDMAVFGSHLALTTSDGLRFIGLKP